jgi:hypothetical protein
MMGDVRRERDEEFRRYVVARSAALMRDLSPEPGVDQEMIETRLRDVLARTYVSWDGPIDDLLLDDHVLAALQPLPMEPDVDVDQQAARHQRPALDPRRLADSVLAEGRDIRRRRSQRVGAVIAAAVLLLAVVPIGQSVRDALAGSPAAAGRQPPRPSPTAAGVDQPAAAANPTELLAWLASLPEQRRGPGLTNASSFLRVVLAGGGTGNVAAAAQVRTRSGRWVDIVRGDVSWPGRLDSSRRWLAFTVRRGGLAQQTTTWVYVVRVDTGQVRARHPVDFGATLIGWFGDRLVIQQPDAAGSLVLFDGHGTGAQTALGPDVIPREGGGDPAFSARQGLAGCVSAGRLGLRPPGEDEACPAAQLLALSADGGLAVTQDLQLLDVRAGGYTPIGGRPAGLQADTVDFVGDDRVLVTLGTQRGQVLLSCRVHGSCSRLSAATAVTGG